MSPLSSQPLMCLLDSLRKKGEISGHQISNQKNLFFQLFAENVGIFMKNTQEEFERAHAAIQVFENILGALLNVEKSIIVPLINPTL